MISRLWTVFLLFLACASAIAWLVALMHEKNVRPVQDLVAFFKKQSKIGRVILGTFFIAMWVIASTKPGDGGGNGGGEGGGGTNNIQMAIGPGISPERSEPCEARSLEGCGLQPLDSPGSVTNSQQQGIHGGTLPPQGGLVGDPAPVTDQWTDFTPITSTNTTRTLDGDDFRRGFVMYRIGTDEEFDFSAPLGATVCADWRSFGAAADWIYVAFTNWTFQVGTNEIDHLRLFSFGKVEPSIRDADGRIATNSWFAPFMASLGVVPEANWQMMGNGEGGTGNGGVTNSQFWHFVTPSNTLQLTWQNVLLERDTNTPVSVQAEFWTDGRFAYRYDLRNVECRIENGELEAAALSNVVIGASIGSLPFRSTLADLATNTPFSILNSPFSIHFHPLSAEDAVNQDRDGDGLTLLDELFAFGTDPDLADTDHDGLIDSEELAAGTDPLNPHSLRPDVCDGYALAMGGFDPLAVPEGSTNTVLEHLFYTGTTNGTIVLPQPSETHAVLSVAVSGYGTGRLAVGDRVVPLFLPEPTRSDPPPSCAYACTVPRGQDVPVSLCGDGTLSVSLNSSEFAFGTIPQIGGETSTGFVNFPNTVATTPCIHDFNARDVSVSLPVGQGASRLQCTWTGTAGVGVVNSPPRAATISGDFSPWQTRSISYELSHPQYLFGQTHHQQTVRFCPQPDEPEDEEEVPPWYEEGEGYASDGSEDDDGEQTWHLCGCVECGDDCTCGCRPPEIEPEPGGEPGGEGEDEDVCPEHEVSYSQCAHLHEAAYTNAVQNLPPLNRVLHIRDPLMWHEIHLEVPSEPHRCCPCPEHWQNYVEVSYKSRDLRLVDGAGLPFKRAGASCTVRVAGAVPSTSPGDAWLAFSRNGESYLSYRYTVLGVAIRSAAGPSLDRYGTENPSFGFPVAVGAAAEAAQLDLVTKVGLGTGNVHVELADATGDFVVWQSNGRKLVDTSGASSRCMTMQGWRQLIGAAGLHGAAYLPVFVTSSSAGHVDLVLRYWANVDGRFVEDEVRQRITSVDPPMMADIDRDGAIGTSDVEAFVDGDVFRFWTNEDVHKGDYVGQVADLTPNAADLVVNGRLDLVNLFPVKLDLAPLIAAWPSATFRLRAGNNRLRFCGADVSPSAAGTIQTNSVVTTGGGNQPGDPLASANLTAVTNAGVAIAPADYLGNGNAPGVLAFEAADEVREGNSPELLVDVGGEIFFRFKLPMAIDRVRNMYSWIGARHLSGEAEYRETVYHRIWGDDSLKSCVFFHGANVSGADAQVWSDTVFKRLWLSGAKMEFYSVDWRSDIGSPANYHQNASNAFVVASQLASTIGAISGDKVMIAHSLGNMVVSSMIQDYDLQVSKYIMCNSAVPAEAYDASLSLRVPQLVHPDWEDYPTNSWAASWHALFANELNDDRKYLGWPGRFANVSQYAMNFYSTGDEVLELANSNNLWPGTGVLGENTWGHLSWHKQELFKGRGLFVGLGATDWSGWNIEENMLGGNKISVAEALQMTDADFKTNTVFYCYPPSMNQPTISLLVRGAHLTQGIPALTPATGIVGLDNVLDSGLSIDINLVNDNGVPRPNGWPSRNNFFGRWQHSDMKDVSYFFNFRFYDKMVEKGNMK